MSTTRRKFLRSAAFGSAAIVAGKHAFAMSDNGVVTGKPIVISTWDAGLAANKAAWEILSNKGRALDAVEKGVMVTEASQNCCVGLGANPDRAPISSSKYSNLRGDQGKTWSTGEY